MENSKVERGIASHSESANAQAKANAWVVRGANLHEEAILKGRFFGWVVGPDESDRAKYLEMMAAVANFESVGNWKEAIGTREEAEKLLREQWSAPGDNLVTTVGANLALDTFLSNASYTLVGPFLGLIGGVSYTTGPAVGDTMASHGGWTEGGTTNDPHYTAPRPTTNGGWNSAGNKQKALTAAKAFAILTTGTAMGCFLVFGTGAVNTIDSTAGTLYSAGTFTPSKAVGNGDTLNVSYTASM